MKQKDNEARESIEESNNYILLKCRNNKENGNESGQKQNCPQVRAERVWYSNIGLLWWLFSHQLSCVFVYVYESSSRRDSRCHSQLWWWNVELPFKHKDYLQLQPQGLSYQCHFLFVKTFFEWNKHRQFACYKLKKKKFNMNRILLFWILNHSIKFEKLIFNYGQIYKATIIVTCFIEAPCIWFTGCFKHLSNLAGLSLFAHLQGT